MGVSGTPRIKNQRWTRGFPSLLCSRFGFVYRADLMFFDSASGKHVFFYHNCSFWAIAHKKFFTNREASSRQTDSAFLHKFNSMTSSVTEDGAQSACQYVIGVGDQAVQ